MESNQSNPPAERTLPTGPSLASPTFARPQGPEPPPEPTTLPESPHKIDKAPPKSFVNPHEVLHDPTLAPGYSASDPIVPFFEKRPFSVFPISQSESTPDFSASHPEEPLSSDTQSLDHDCTISTSRSVSPARVMEAESVNKDNADANADAEADIDIDEQAFDHPDKLSSRSDSMEPVATELQGDALNQKRSSSLPGQSMSAPTTQTDKSKPASVADSPKRGGKWTKQENEALIESVKWAVQNKGPEVTVFGMWEMISVRMEETHGFSRTYHACRIWYNRKLREQSGFDERNTPNPHQMTTSSL